MDAILYLTDLNTYNLSEEILLEIEPPHYKRIRRFIPLPEKLSEKYLKKWSIEIPVSEIPIFGKIRAGKFSIVYKKLLLQEQICFTLRPDQLNMIFQVLFDWAYQNNLELPEKGENLCHSIKKYLSEQDLILPRNIPERTMRFTQRKL